MKRLALIALALMVAVPAVGQVEFTFEGYAMYTPGPDMAGATMTVYGIANPPMSVPTPIPMDFVNFEYTVYIHSMNVVSYTYDAPTMSKDYVFNGGEIEIFEDSIVAGTTGDYANTSTFVDGTNQLAALVDSPWDMHLDDPIGFGTHSGSGIGTCDMVGGAAHALLVSMDYELNDWVFAGTAISEPWFPFITVPQGYHHVFGVKIMFPYDPTANEDAAWGDVKSLYR